MNLLIASKTLWNFLIKYSIEQLHLASEIKCHFRLLIKINELPDQAKLEKSLLAFDTLFLFKSKGLTTKCDSMDRFILKVGHYRPRATESSE